MDFFILIILFALAQSEMMALRVYLDKNLPWYFMIGMR